MKTEFRFEPSQRELIRGLAKHLRNVGYIWTTFAFLDILLDFFDLLTYLSSFRPINIPDISNKTIENQQFMGLLRTLLRDPFYIVVGICAIKSASFFQKIGSEQGEDLENLLGALSQLRNSLFMLYLFAIIFVVIVWIRIIFFWLPT